ncbi:hypothetical protein BU23DRAFT_477137 [Bimuria novae-zelandiae CBS 107.79]|uniref:Zn(2)-C6 fungal-type domain-containing protein n=1 Tax=Bimuria novae-zelandiae CBS 107.79 TaxID=1447943 RepID=A0A6A5UXC6_9PLEO|nr:hypothetical protein BU23DRAFT_477137 [Bimuria novae-zelandiae CBS 107.79]
MNRLPSIPSRPAHAQPYASRSPYQSHSVAPSRPEISTQHHRPRDSQGSQSHAQQLPSLRTLLEPELLENKPSDQLPRPAGPHLFHGTVARYGSASPTLKRRHDFDSYSHDHSDSHALATRPPPVHRHAPYSASTDSQPATFSSLNTTHGPQASEFSRHNNSSGTTYADSTTKSFRPSSTTSAYSAISDPARALSGHIPLHDDGMDLDRGGRRRTDGPQRAPIRSKHCVGQQEVPGEGLCYVFDDGSWCRVVIDGEPVNPSWGVTKAGKPRKRLAQACLTCREKKIKCEPGYPKCHQCAKSQRVCRGGLNQPGMSNTSGETSPSSSSVLFKNQSTELVSPVAGPDKPRTLEEQYSKAVDTWNTGSSFTKPRTFRPNSIATSRDMSVHSMDSDWSGSANNQDSDDPRRGSHHDRLAIQWEQDPYDTDARLTMQLLDLYFLHAGRATYGMFPRRPFLAWVETNREKNQDHLMLLYSVLAMGSVFSLEPEKRSIGKLYAAVAAYAMEKRFGKFTLQLCQSRLMLALYNFARGKAQEAWDYCGAGLRALSALKLNTEDGIKELPETTADIPYCGFDRLTLEECCRRTFWSGFLMDVSSDAFTATTTLDLIHQQRYNGFCGGTLCVINIEDTFLRLPCLENMFDASTPCDAPLFDVDILSPQAHTGPGPLGYMAYLTLISTIWGDVVTFTSRAVHRPGPAYERHYEAFYAKTYERLEAWLAMLPHSLRYTSQNLDISITDGFAGSFVSLHALYYTTLIRLNRHTRLTVISTDKIRRNINQAFYHATNFVQMMHSLAAENRRQRLPPNAAAEFLFSTPFPGYALMLSIDVLAAAGTVASLPSLIEMLGTASSCLEELASFWASARTQHRVVANRIKRLTDIAMQEEQGIRNGALGPFWRCPESLETAFGDNDSVYKAEQQLLLDVLNGPAGTRLWRTS